MNNIEHQTNLIKTSDPFAQYIITLKIYIFIYIFNDIIIRLIRFFFLFHRRIVRYCFIILL